MCSVIWAKLHSRSSAKTKCLVGHYGSTVVALRCWPCAAVLAMLALRWWPCCAWLCAADPALPALWWLPFNFAICNK